MSTYIQPTKPIKPTKTLMVEERMRIGAGASLRDLIDMFPDVCSREIKIRFKTIGGYGQNELFYNKEIPNSDYNQKMKEYKDKLLGYKQAKVLVIQKEIKHFTSKLCEIITDTEDLTALLPATINELDKELLEIETELTG